MEPPLLLLCSSRALQSFSLLRHALLETVYKQAATYNLTHSWALVSCSGTALSNASAISAILRRQARFSKHQDSVWDFCATVRRGHSLWTLPADEWEARRARQVQRNHAAAVQSIRNCCTFEELLRVLPSQGSAPELVIQVALQAPRVLEWPLSTSDRLQLLDVLERLSNQCAMNLEEYALSHVAAFLGVCARARFVPGELLVPLQQRLEAEVREQRLKDAAVAVHVAALVRHLSYLRTGRRQLWSAAAAAAAASVLHASTADIAQMLSAFGRANIPSNALYTRAMASAPRTLRLATPQDVALLMRCLARAKCSPPPPNFVGQLAHNLTLRGPDYDLVTLADLASACNGMGIVPRSKTLYDMMAQLAAKAMRRQVTALEAPLLPGLSIPPATHPTAAIGSGGGSYSGARTPREQPVTPQTVFTLLTALSRMQPPRHPPALLQAAAALLFSLLRRAAALGEAVEAADWERLDGVALMLGEAGHAEVQRELLRQVSGVRPKLPSRIPGEAGTYS